MKKQQCWEIKIGNKLWLVLTDKKPIIKKSKVVGIEFNAVIVDEIIKEKYIPGDLSQVNQKVYF